MSLVSFAAKITAKTARKRNAQHKAGVCGFRSLETLMPVYLKTLNRRITSETVPNAVL